MSDRPRQGSSLVDAVPPHRREAAARGLQVLAVLGVVIGLLGAVVSWRVVGALDAVTADSADVTAEALTSLGSTLDVAADLVVSVDGTLAALEDALVATNDSLADGATALESVSTLAEDASPALDSATETLRSLEVVGQQVDDALTALSALPIGPDYDPSESFATTVGQLADDLDPLAASFATTATDLEDVSDSTIQLRADLVELTVGVREAGDRLDDSADLVADYRATAERAGEAAARAGEGLGTDLTLLRVLLVIGCLVLAVGQVVPWLLARALRAPG